MCCAVVRPLGTRLPESGSGTAASGQPLGWGIESFYRCSIRHTYRQWKVPWSPPQQTEFGGSHGILP